MHNADKTNRSGIGDLTRSKNKKVINPFPDGQKFRKACHNIGVHFAYGHRIDDMHALYPIVHAPRLCIRTDLNETRCSAFYGLIYSLVCMNRGLKHYALLHPEYPNATLPDIDSWVTLSEITSIMKISSSHVTFVQYEKLYTSALGYLHKVYIMDEYRKKEHEIVDLDKVTAATQLPTMTKKVAQFTPVGTWLAK